MCGVCSVDAPDKGVTLVPGRAEHDGMRFQHTLQKGGQFKTCELFLSGIFYLMSLDLGWLRLTEIAKSESMITGETAIRTAKNNRMAPWVPVCLWGNAVIAGWRKPDTLACKVCTTAWEPRRSEWSVCVERRSTCFPLPPSPPTLLRLSLQI